MQRAGSKLLEDGAVLLVETHLQGLLTSRVQREQVEVIVRAAMQHASAAIHDGIDERVGGAAVFRLDVKRRVARFDVRIVTEEHSAVRLDLRMDSGTPRRNSSTRFDRVALESLL